MRQCRKLSAAIIIITLCTGLAIGDASWVGTVDNDFMNSANWSPVEVPAGNMTIEDGGPYDPTYSYTGTSYIQLTSLTVNSGAHLTVTAGELRPSESAYWLGDVTVSGGVLNVRSNVYIGHGGGTGTVTVTDGWLTCKAILTLGYGSGADGTLNVWGGTVDMGSGTPRVAYSGGTGRISIKNDGVAYCAGDASDYFEDLESSGLLTTDSGWEIDIEYVSGEDRTYLSTHQVPYATQPQPQGGQTTDPSNTILSWYPGEGAIRSEIYLGTSPAAVAAAEKLAGDVDGNGLVNIVDLNELAIQWLSTPSDPCPDLDGSGIVDLPDLAKVGADWQNSADEIYLGATSGITFDPGVLDPGTTYYWRVDSVRCDGIEPGDIWNFQTASPPLPAFPGAEGFGAMANGGRGGDVYTVTNLNDDGAGSFKYGVESASGPRTIVFAVSGYISHAYDDPVVVPGNITIAGQTAPGDGVGLRGSRLVIDGDDTIVRYFRIRKGKYDKNGVYADVDCLNIHEGVSDTIIDHVSLMFSTDENFSFFAGDPHPNNLTMQYSSSTWGMERHNAGGLWDLDYGTCHHSLWAHHRTRNPKARPYGLLEWINNVTYHWRSEGFIMGDSYSDVDWYANVMGCYYVSVADFDFGLDSTPLSKARLADADGLPNFHLYLSDTLIDANGDGVLNGYNNGYGIVSGTPDISSTPFAGAPISVTIDDPLTAYKKVLSSAGALRLDATYAGPLRDELDDLLIESVENQESILVAKDTPVTSDPEEPPSNGEQYLADEYGITNNGFGTLLSTAAPTDTDGDGMPDFWERSIGYSCIRQNHNALVPAGAYVSSGYTLLEEYLHFCAIPHAVIPMRTASEPSSLSVDLRRYTRGFNVAPVVFSLSNIQNGSAAIQPDGYTVVFEPALDFSGRARFDFTVTDGDGSTWMQTLAVLVKSPDPEEQSYVVNSGGTDEGRFTADAYFSAGDTYTNTTEIDMTGLINPAPEAVYQSERHGDFNYTFPGLISGANYLVRLHFAEIFHDAVGDRIFDVAINGTPMLTNYDIFAITGARYKAHIEEFMVQGDANGQIVVEFTTDVDNSLICGIEVLFAGIPDPTGGQAEDAVYGNGVVFEDTNTGFNGTGYVNFPTSDGYLEFTGIDGGSGGDASLDIRFALGAAGTRTGDLIVNGVSQSIMFDSTGDWTTWSLKNVTVNLNSGLNNTIRFESNGEDLANIDEITVTP